MSSKLKRLIEAYVFLTDCRSAEECSSSVEFAAEVDRRIDEVLRAIVAYEPVDLAEAVAQTRAVVSALSRADADTDMAAYLKEICEGHLARLEVQVARSAPASRSAVLPPDWSCFDVMTERVGILDREYRYLFTNRANAEFHRIEAGAFVGVPNYTVVGDGYFRIHKTRFDAALAGQHLTTYSGHPLASRGQVFSSTLAPAYDGEGRVVAVIVTSREIARASVPPHLLLVPTPAK